MKTRKKSTLKKKKFQGAGVFSWIKKTFSGKKTVKKTTIEGISTQTDDEKEVVHSGNKKRSKFCNENADTYERSFPVFSNLNPVVFQSGEMCFSEDDLRMIARGKPILRLSSMTPLQRKEVHTFIYFHHPNFYETAQDRKQLFEQFVDQGNTKWLRNLVSKEWQDEDIIMNFEKTQISTLMVQYVQGKLVFQTSMLMPHQPDMIDLFLFHAEFQPSSIELGKKSMKRLLVSVSKKDRTAILTKTLELCHTHDFYLCQVMK
jgi:hypothetical protein